MHAWPRILQRLGWPGVLGLLAMAMAVYKYQQKKQLAVMGFINQATYTALTGKEACC